MGARPLSRLFVEEIENPLSRAIVEEKPDQSAHIFVDTDKDETALLFSYNTPKEQSEGEEKKMLSAPQPR